MRLRISQMALANTITWRHYFHFYSIYISRGLPQRVTYKLCVLVHCEPSRCGATLSVPAGTVVRQHRLAMSPAVGVHWRRCRSNFQPHTTHYRHRAFAVAGSSCLQLPAATKYALSSVCQSLQEALKVIPFWLSYRTRQTRCWITAFDQNVVRR